MPYVWEIPFFRNASHMLRNIFGNWRRNGVTTLQSGGSSSGTYRPNLVHAPSANCGDGHLSGIDAIAFAAVPTGVYDQTPAY
jgi:hypothetical protein